ncbi:MAG: type II toxin-antitoxin system VapC family toxin [Chloroflexi bacterium]|nr:type II toxin-antitoxin system VapC family toxin [Chloroflexota bacterium]
MILLDSNIIIYSAEPEYADLQQLVEEQDTAVSIASYIEVLGFRGLDDYRKRFFEEFFQSIEVIHLTTEIADRAIGLRQQRRIELGDAIIAATALLLSIPLLTRNTRDFRWIDNLDLYNPIPDDQPLTTDN